MVGEKYMSESPAELLKRWVLTQCPDQANWLISSLDTIAEGSPEKDLHVFLGYAPRKLGKADLALSAEDLAAADAAHPGWNPSGWSVDGAARVAALLATAGNRPFSERFKDLRRTADVAEMIALYRGLPLYPDPEKLHFEVGEGLRSNIRAVFEAIAHHNPYPRDHFDEHRWNHMILKSLFVDSILSPIVGLKDRANPELARILVDYAQERWAAGRPVTPELWIPVKRFRTDPAIADQLSKAISDGHLTEEALS
ncbi:MAG: hypothetical protein ACI92Z_002339 [Paracoccaceae bacterium]|jgi:hypothetical protein